jgi:hypothetical protein
MKRALTKFTYLIFTLTLAACGSSNDGGGGGTNNGGNGGNNANPIAVTPMDPRCINGTATCPSSTYNNYGGWTTYALPNNTPGNNYMNYFGQNGFCGCPGGYSPSYNGNMGLGCLSSMALQPYYNSAVLMNMGTNGTWGGGSATINIPQVSNIPGSAYQGACTSQITQSCLINQPTSCGPGATCRQVITGSGLGVCTNQNQMNQGNINGGGYNNGYNTGYNTGYNNPGYNSGYNTGYNTGYNPGYNSGYTGYNTGYYPGYNSGYTTGYNPGYNTGYNNGGFNAGFYGRWSL